SWSGPSPRSILFPLIEASKYGFELNSELIQIRDRVRMGFDYNPSQGLCSILGTAIVSSSVIRSQFRSQAKCVSVP
uniref:Uncharacterized protein n=1 Tax=Cannabis sativa TaxID=3483 RepID=A0A803P589_CANSA